MVPQAYIALGLLACLLTPLGIYIVRLIFNLLADTQPEKMFEFYEWFGRLLKELNIEGVKHRVVYSRCCEKGLLLVTLPGGRVSNTEHLVLASASRSQPVIHRCGRIAVVALAGRVANTLTSMLRRRRGLVYLEPKTAKHLKMIYHLVKQVYTRIAGCPNTLASYLTMKALGLLIARGLISLRPTLIELVERRFPPEPPWIAYRVRRQLKREQLIPP